MGLFKALIGAVTPISLSGPLYLRQQLDLLGVPRIALSNECVAEIAKYATETHKTISKLRRQNYLDGLTDFYEYIAIVTAMILDREKYMPSSAFANAADPGGLADEVRTIMRRHGVSINS